MGGPFPGVLPGLPYADGMIDAARVILGALDGRPVPDEVSPDALRALVMLAIIMARTSVVQAGITAEDAIDAHVRRLITVLLQDATIIAHDGAAPGR